MQQAISAGHEETLEAAKTILINGGNAFDAAIAAGFAMFITETCMSSAFAGGFALCYTPSTGVEMLDFFTQTPRSKKLESERDFYPIHVDFGNETETFHVGLASSATPGIIQGLFELHRKHGTMSIQDLLAPAKKLAKEGITINQFQQIDIGLLESILRVDASVKDVFFKNGEILQVGDIMNMPHLHSFLEFLEYETDEGFYKGEIGQQVDKISREKGGYIRRTDFENYNSFWRKPLSLDYQNHKIYCPAGPSLGGALLALTIKNFEQTNCWTSTIRTIRSRFQSIQEIESAMTRTFPELGFQAYGTISSKGTSHFNIVDKWNNAISFTCSIGEGSGHFLSGTDMQLNNMLGESFLLPDGFHSWTENTRLNSMMTPTMILDKLNNLRYSGGSGGAGRIPYMIAQVVDNILSLDLSLEQATEASRVFVDGSTIHAEKSATLPADLMGLALQEWDYQSLFFGGVHSIWKSENKKWSATGDDRRYGVAEVF